MFGKGPEYEADSLCFWFCIRIYSTIVEVFVQFFTQDFVGIFLNQSPHRQPTRTSVDTRQRWHRNCLSYSTPLSLRTRCDEDDARHTCNHTN